MTAPGGGNVPHVAVVGGGIVGLCSAFWLKRAGLGVTVVHASPVDDTTACGSAGALAVADILPITGPGVWAKVPGWLLDPLGPLHIRMRYLPRLAPWMLRFLAAGTPPRIRATAEATARLLGTAEADYATLLSETGMEHLLVRQGALWVYRSEESRAATAADWDVRRSFGTRFEAINRGDIEDIEPALGPAAHCAYHLPDWQHFLDPRALLSGLADHLKARGVRFARANVERLEETDSHVNAVATSRGERIACDHAVIAAGAWSSRLTRRLGDPVPLESERGYNTTLPNAGVEMKIFVDFADDHFVISPMSIGLRIGGAVEFAGLAAPPNYDRCDAFIKLAKRYLPTLNTEGGTRWMGNRPSTPDGLPVISRASRLDNVYYAFGHGHLGLTGGAATGRIIAALLEGRDPGLDMTPFRVQRF